MGGGGGPGEDGEKRARRKGQRGGGATVRERDGREGTGESDGNGDAETQRRSLAPSDPFAASLALPSLPSLSPLLSTPLSPSPLPLPPSPSPRSRHARAGKSSSPMAMRWILAASVAEVATCDMAVISVSIAARDARSGAWADALEPTGALSALSAARAWIRAGSDDEPARRVARPPPRAIRTTKLATRAIDARGAGRARHSDPAASERGARRGGAERGKTPHARRARRAGARAVANAAPLPRENTSRGARALGAEPRSARRAPPPLERAAARDAARQSSVRSGGSFALPESARRSRAAVPLAPARGPAQPRPPSPPRTAPERRGR